MAGVRTRDRRKTARDDEFDRGRDRRHRSRRDVFLRAGCRIPRSACALTVAGWIGMSVAWNERGWVAPSGALADGTVLRPAHDGREGLAEIARQYEGRLVRILTGNGA